MAVRAASASATAPAGAAPGAAGLAEDGALLVEDAAQLRALADFIREEGSALIKDRRYLLTRYPKVVVGRELVTWLVENASRSCVAQSEEVTRMQQARGEEEKRLLALSLAERLRVAHLLTHVTRAHVLKDDHFFYRFAQDESVQLNLPASIANALVRIAADAPPPFFQALWPEKREPAAGLLLLRGGARALPVLVIVCTASSGLALFHGALPEAWRGAAAAAAGEARRPSYSVMGLYPLAKARYCLTESLVILARMSAPLQRAAVDHLADPLERARAERSPGECVVRMYNIALSTGKHTAAEVLTFTFFTPAQRDTWIKLLSEAKVEFDPTLGGGAGGAEMAAELSLEAILETPAYRPYLNTFLAENFALENSQFLSSVEAFRQLRDPATRRRAAGVIVEVFVEPKSPLAVNIDYPTRVKLMERLRRPDGDADTALFDQAADVVVRLLRTDAFRRFEHSDLYQALLKLHRAAQAASGADEAESVAGRRAPSRLLPPSGPVSAAAQGASLSGSVEGAAGAAEGEPVSSNSRSVQQQGEAKGDDVSARRLSFCPVPFVEDLDTLRKLALAIASAGLVKDRLYHLKKYRMCLVGSVLVDWFVANSYATTRLAAVSLGQRLMDAEFLTHVTRDHDFRDGNFFYRFTPLANTPGASPVTGEGKVDATDFVNEEAVSLAVTAQELMRQPHHAGLLYVKGVNYVEHFAVLCFNSNALYLFHPNPLRGALPTDPPVRAVPLRAADAAPPVFHVDTVGSVPVCYLQLEYSDLAARNRRVRLLVLRLAGTEESQQQWRSEFRKIYRSVSIVRSASVDVSLAGAE